MSWCKLIRARHMSTNGIVAKWYTLLFFKRNFWHHKNHAVQHRALNGRNYSSHKWECQFISWSVECVLVTMYHFDWKQARNCSTWPVRWKWFIYLWLISVRSLNTFGGTISGSERGCPCLAVAIKVFALIYPFHFLLTLFLIGSKCSLLLLIALVCIVSNPADVVIYLSGLLDSLWSHPSGSPEHQKIAMHA